MQYRIHPEAEAEYQQTYGYYQKESANLAEQYTKEILIGLQTIIDSPYAWPVIKFDVVTNSKFEMV